FLEAFFFFQPGGVSKKIGLEDARVLHHPVGGEGQSAHRQLGVRDAVEQGRCGGLQLAAQIGGRLQPDAAVGGLGQGAAVPVNVHRATVTAAVAVFPVVADVQSQAVGDKVLVHQLVDQAVGHL